MIYSIFKCSNCGAVYRFTKHGEWCRTAHENKTDDLVSNINMRTWRRWPRIRRSHKSIRGQLHLQPSPNLLTKDYSSSESEKSSSSKSLSSSSTLTGAFFTGFFAGFLAGAFFTGFFAGFFAGFFVTISTLHVKPEKYPALKYMIIDSY